MRIVGLPVPITLRPTDSIDVTLKIKLVNDTDGEQRIEGVRWEPVLVDNARGGS